MPSQREIARQLGVSVATVSRVVHGDSSVNPDTAERVRKALRESGYELDPVVSAGLSKVRRQDFYRESLAWIMDVNREDYAFMQAMLTAGDEYAKRIGYKIERFYTDDFSERGLKSLVRMLRAQGIRGAILGSFKNNYDQLPFPWDEMCWVTIGNNFTHPQIHSVGRDYRSDLDTGVAWLAELGAKRPVLLQYQGFHTFLKPFLQSKAWELLHCSPTIEQNPFHEIIDIESSLAWLDDYQPDSYIILYNLPDSLDAIRQRISKLPSVMLSSPIVPNQTIQQLNFRAEFEAFAQSAVNILHRQLRNKDFGLSSYRQSVIFSSRQTKGSFSSA